MKTLYGKQEDARLSAKEVAFRPINPKNEPRPEEANIINFMKINNKYVGVIEINGQRYFVHAYGKVAEAGCM